MKTTNLFLIIISLFLGACAQEKVTNVNPEFSAYVLRFQKIGHMHELHSRFFFYYLAASLLVISGTTSNKSATSP